MHVADLPQKSGEGTKINAETCHPFLILLNGNNFDSLHEVTLY